MQSLFHRAVSAPCCNSAISCFGNKEMLRQGEVGACFLGAGRSVDDAPSRPRLMPVP